MQTSPFNPEDDGRMLAAIIDSSEDAIIAKNLEGIILSWNRGAERMYGYSAREAIGRRISFLIPSELRHEFDEILTRIRSDQRVAHLETRRLTKDGRELEISLTVSPIKDSAGQILGASTIARDITEQKRVEQALRGSEARWRAIVESAVDGIVVIDARGHVEAFNRAAERLFGYAAHEVVGRNVTMLMPPPYHDEHDGYLARYRATGVQKIIGIGREVTGLRKDGSAFPLHLSVGEVLIEGESRFTGILHDLTERVALEQALKGSEARWRAIIESAVDGIVVIDARGQVETFNRAAERLFGYAADEVVGHNVNMLMPAPYHDEHDGYLGRYRATGVQKIIGIGREVTGLRKDGSEFPLHLSVGEVFIEGESKFTGILHDLTERVQLETRLREQSALTRLGEMAAVVAHEVKNPLTGIRGAIQVIGGRLPAGSKDVQIIGDIIARIDALNDLMKDLLLFARPPQPRVAAVDVLSLLKNVRDLLRQDPALRGLRIDVTGDAIVLPADAELLKIVVQNLLLNGAHAMQGQGLIQVVVTSADGLCQIAIADEGPGIPAEVLDKLFTPFFTTKARGTGLGLSTARRFVEAHGGTLAIESPATGGTTATIRLPVRLP
jgi:two-component system sensor kinase FixL